jgi:hypothetical protein
MAYLTESRLRNYYRQSSQFLSTMNESFSGIVPPEATIFLSHSHLDRELIMGFIQEVEELGIYVYVDWNDGEMPDRTDRDTALRIKERIKQNDLFMVFATENALNSRWVPWEIGVADQAKLYDKIFVIPIIKDGTKYSGNEYLQLYNKIILSNDNDLAAFRPRQEKGILFESVIKKKGYIYG